MSYERVPVTFKFHVPWASKILLAGLFNAWNGEPMIQRYENGEHYFELVKELHPGDIQYKYIVFFDLGYYQWEYDSSKPTFVDPLGNVNNITHIEHPHSVLVEVTRGVSKHVTSSEVAPIAIKATRSVPVYDIPLAPEPDLILAAEAVAIDDDDEPIDIPKTEIEVEVEAEETEDPLANIDVAALEKSIDPVLLKKCKATFLAVDKDNSGLIAYEEFIIESKRLNVGLSEKDLTKKFKEKDLNGDGVISWGEFLLAMVSHSSKKVKK